MQYQELQTICIFQFPSRITLFKMGAWNFKMSWDLLSCEVIHLMTTARRSSLSLKEHDKECAEKSPLYSFLPTASISTWYLQISLLQQKIHTDVDCGTFSIALSRTQGIRSRPTHCAPETGQQLVPIKQNQDKGRYKEILWSQDKVCLLRANIGTFSA